MVSPNSFKGTRFSCYTGLVDNQNDFKNQNYEVCEGTKHSVYYKGCLGIKKGDEFTLHCMDQKDSTGMNYLCKDSEAQHDTMNCNDVATGYLSNQLVRRVQACCCTTSMCNNKGMISAINNDEHSSSTTGAWLIYFGFFLFLIISSTIAGFVEALMTNNSFKKGERGSEDVLDDVPIESSVPQKSEESEQSLPVEAPPNKKDV
ncbi:unnamed protein product [Caenorhabditis auriculariae]|uniref:Activin types I and II receptor domain-containing protein n=1 Tax=Caenorhabditis auriculariae TaxID=2777116 RepID=A0A8S1GUA5_9PELO|nr:unnamed protein product [Caenorhabditis auriculariae]